MSNFEKIMAIINVIAIIAIPIVAVFVGQHLQNRSQQRKDKLEIFKILMMNRVGWSVESVHAMNIILSSHEAGTLSSAAGSFYGATENHTLTPK